MRGSGCGVVVVESWNGIRYEWLSFELRCHQLRQVASLEGVHRTAQTALGREVRERCEAAGLGGERV